MRIKPEYGVPGPDTREGYERKAWLVIDRFNRIMDSDNEQSKNNAIVSMWPPLEKLKWLPNGRLSLGTIDSRLRSMSLIFDMPGFDTPMPGETEDEEPEPRKDSSDDSIEGE